MGRQVSLCLGITTPPTSEARTSPAQKISLGHHDCLGGNATWEGSAEESGALGLATTVESVMLGGAVAVAAVADP